MEKVSNMKITMEKASIMKITKEETAYNRSSSLDHQFSHEAVTLHNNRVVDAAMALLDVPIRLQGDSKEDDDHAFQDVEIATREQQIRGVDEAFLTYSLAEKAALMIQQNFRSRHPELKKNAEESNNVNFDNGDSLVEEIDETEDEEEKDPGKVYTLILIAVFGFGAILWKGVQGCLKLIRGTSDTGVDDPGVSNMATSGPTPTPSGGGGGGAAPPGGQPPVQAMASNAAGAAGGAAGAGVAAGAAVGAAAAGAAAAGGMAAAVATVAGVAAAAATVAGVSMAVSSNTTVALSEAVPILSECGLVDPDMREGRVTFFLEGFERKFDGRETSLIENLLVEAYNNITLGPGLDSCDDKYLRELQDATLYNQTYFPATEFNNSYMETIFETVVLCDGCPTENPMFGDNEVSRRRLQEFASIEFFQRFIQSLLIDLKQLSDDGDIMEGFVQMAKAYVSDFDGGEAMVAEITSTYNADGEIAAINFIIEENGEQTITTVNVIPPTPDPTFSPTTPAPSLSPTLSSMPSPVDATAPPTGIPSVQPSLVPTDNPSTSPSGMPSSVPSGMPSETPSSAPSSVPSQVPSVLPSAVPSSVPSFVPSFMPSMVPSTVPSYVPSSGPSESPSAVPSFVPSFLPSMVPSFVPSNVPSFVPSVTPSGIPSIVPSQVPSGVPSMIPSAVPSKNPSSSPTTSPSRDPTPAPSERPTWSPTLSVRPTPCIWRASERKQERNGNGPNENCTAFDYNSNYVPVAIIDQSQEGDTVTFRVSNRVFYGSIMSMLAMEYDVAADSAVCDVQTAETFDASRSYTGVCTNGQLDVKFYLYMCDSDQEMQSDYCSRPTDLDDYWEHRYLLDCYELCETEGPTSGPTYAPTIEPSATPSSSPSKAPSEQPSVSSIPSGLPSSQPSGSPTDIPSKSPSMQPSRSPTDIPSKSPSMQPSRSPSKEPSEQPTVSNMPSKEPTISNMPSPA